MKAIANGNILLPDAELHGKTLLFDQAIVSITEEHAIPNCIEEITDALRSAGMPDGTYENGGQLFTLKGIECRLQDGTIAGSVLRLFSYSIKSSLLTRIIFPSFRTFIFPLCMIS